MTSRQPTRPRDLPAESKLVATYTYRRADGTADVHVERWEPGEGGRAKTFRPRLEGASNYGLPSDHPRVLYRLPEVLAAVEAGQTVYLCEGEKDVDTAYGAFGVCATTMLGGTGGWPAVRDHAVAALHGATVAIVADRDDAGRKHAAQAFADLVEHCRDVRILEPTFGKDLADHVDDGRLRMEDLFDVTPTVESSPAPEDEPSSTSWAPVDLADVLAGVEAEPPTVFIRSDNLVSLLYRGRVHIFQGESESLKSWAAQLAVVQVLAAGARALYIDFEDDERGVIPRLRALGATVEQIARGLTYVRPDEPLRGRDRTAYTAGGIELERILAGPPFQLAIVDGVTEAMTAEGLDLISNGDVATWQRLLPRRISRTGAAVVGIDHVSKNMDGPVRFALGAQHKLSGISGASYTFTIRRRLARASRIDETITGSAVITVNKDRPGFVRGIAGDGPVAVLELTSYPDGGVIGRLLPPDQSSTPGASTTEMIEILGYLLRYPGQSTNQMEKAELVPKNRLRPALAYLAEAHPDPLVVIDHLPRGKRTDHLHSITPAGEALLEELTA